MAGLDGGAAALRLGGGFAGRGEGGFRFGQFALGGLVGGGQLRVARVEGVGLRLEPLVLLLCGGGAFPRVVAAGRQPVDLGLSGRGPGPGGADLAGQPGEALPPVGEGAGGVLEAPLLRREGALQLGAVGDGVLQGPLGGLQRGLQFGFLLPHAGGLALQVLGVAAAALLGRLAGGALDARVGEGDGAADPLGEAGQLVPGVLGALEARGEAAHLLLKGRLAFLGFPQRGLRGPSALLQGGLVVEFRLQGRPEPYEVVGEEPEAGVAQFGLDDGGAAGGGGLAAEGFELAAQFVGEVLHAGEVGLHGVEFPQRLLLALAVLEDARGLLDEGAAAGGVGVQDGVELALPDDDVHFAADTGVAEEFLDIEEPAGVAVDLVFAGAAAEHDPREGDFRVVDGQGAVGVVDREGHLGAAQGRAARGAGEDDVLHLAAAQGFGALFAHDPGQGVDDVGFPGAVGADDAGDARFEPQGGGGGERLESAEGQGLEVHGGTLPAGFCLPREHGGQING